MCPDPSVPAGWIRAVSYATHAPDGDEALAGVLAEAVAALGAASAAVLEGETPRLRECWGCDPASLSPLLQEGSAVREAMQRLEEWVDAGLELAAPAGRARERILLSPLLQRGMAHGALLLLFAADAPPPPDALQVASAYAGLAALVLENDRLYHEAREAMQAREHFVTALNHELRTPAHAVLLFADLLRTEAGSELPANVAAALQETEKHVSQMVDVLRKILDLDTGAPQAPPQRADILHPREVVAELLRRVEPAAKRKNLTISLYTPRGLPPIQTEAEHFSRILLHLFSNAIKYTARGAVEVRLERTTRRVGRSRQEPVLVVRVRDTGCGIPAEQLQRIFEPFAQVEEGARTDSRRRGLGLGLPLARQLARAIGGEITILSTPDVGTEAALVVPYHRTG